MLKYEDFIIKKMDTNLYAVYCKKTKDIFCLETWQVLALPKALEIMEKIIEGANNENTKTNNNSN